MPNLPYISPELLREYQRQINRQASPATAKRRISALKRFFGWAEKEGHIPENPIREIPAVSAPSQEAPVVPKYRFNPSSILKLGIPVVLIVLIFLLARKVKLPIPFIPAPASETAVVTQTPFPTSVPEIPIDRNTILAEIKQEAIKLVQQTLEWASFEEGNLLIGGAPVSSLTLSTGDTTDGDITINPDGSGIAHFLFEGTGQNFLNAQAPNLTSGSLYYGIVANNAVGYDLIRLQSGSNPITRFSVDALGNTDIGGSLNVDGNISTADTERLTAEGGLTNITGYSQGSGNFAITQSAGETATIIKKDSALSDLLTLTLDERGKANSIYSTLTLKRYDGAVEAAALYVDEGNAIFDGQLRLGRFSSNPTSIGTGSIVYNSSDNKIYFWNGSAWTEVGAGSTLSFTSITSGTNTTAAMIVGSGASLTYSGTGTINATTLNSFADTSFLRSDTSDNFTSGTLTTDAGTTLDVNGDLAIADTNVTFDGASTTFTFTGTATLDSSGTVQLGVDDDFLPQLGAGDADIGASGTRWDNVYAVAGNFSGTVTGNDFSCTDCLDFTEFADNLTLDAATDIALGALTLSTSGTGALNFASTGQVTLAGNVDATAGLDVTGASLTVGTSYSWTTAGVITAATDETINGVDISAGAVSDVVSLTLVTAGNTWASSGNLTISGNLDVNGTTNDIAGTLNLSGNSLTSSGDLTIDATGNNILSPDSLNIGGAAAQLYNFFAASTAGASVAMDAAIDLYVQGDLEVDGTIYGTISGSVPWSNLTNPTAPLSLNHSAFTTTFAWTSTGALDAFTINFNNNSTTATTQNALILNNAAVDAFTDTNTENLLLLQQLDTTTTGTTVVDNALKIDSAASSGITDAIEITNSAGNITNGINLVDTAGGTFTTGINFSGTFTNEISLRNAETISNATDGTITLAANSGAVTLSLSGTAATLSNTAGNLTLDSASNTLVIAATDTTLTASGIATIDFAATVAIDSTTYNLGGGSATTIQTPSGNANLTIAANGTGIITVDPTGAGSIVFGSADVTSMTFTTDNNAANDFNFVGGATFNDEVTLTLAGTEALTINNTTQGAADLVSINSTWTADNTADALAITTTYNVSTVVGTQYGLNLTNADNGGINTGVIDALALFSNDQATEILADGVIIRHNAASGTLTDALQIQNTTAGGTITNAINIVQTAGTITTGINIGSGVGTAIVLQQGESIDNTTDNQINLNLGSAGTLLLTSATSSTISNSAGSIILDSTGGTIDINDATIDVATQATDIEIIDGNAAALTISQGANNYITIDTTDTLENLILSAGTSGTTRHVRIGATAASGTPDLLVLDQKNTASDPTGTLGALYINNSGKFMVYEGGTPAWKEVCNKTDQACGTGSGSAWSALTNPITNLTLEHTSAGTGYTTTFNWTDTTNNANFFTFNFDNNGGTAGTDQVVVISNAESTATTGDLNTEALLLLQQLDTTTAGTTVVDNALKIDSAASSGITDAIEITNSAGNITNGINLVDTAGGTFTTGINFSGTFTNEISLRNAETISNATDGTIILASNSGAVTLSLSGTAATISNTAGDLTVDAGTNLVLADATIQLTGGTTVTLDLFNAATTTLSILNSTGGVAANVAIEGDLTVTGGDITGANSETIDIGEADNGTITFTGVGETNNGVINFDLETNAYPTINTGADTILGLAAALQFVGAQTISTSTGDLTIDSGGNLVLADTTINLTGSSPIIDLTSATTLSINTTTNRPITTGTGLFTAGGALTVNGNTTLGDSSTVDTLTGNLLTSVVTSGATTQTALSLATASLTTGEALDITATYVPTAGGTQSAIDINLTNSPSTTANTLRGIDLGFTDAGTLANTIYGFYVDVTTANANDTTYAAAFLGGNVGIGTTTPGSLLELLGSQPASVGTTPGTAATDVFTVTGGTGGDTTIATTGVGGIGADLTLTGGAGGVAGSAATASTGGKGGSFTFTGGIGGAASVVGTGTNIGGAGGNLEITGGAGGAASGGGSNTGGTGGDLYLVGGAAGTGGSPAVGDVLLGITSGGTARGNVGIGTTAPGEKLEVVGNIISKGTSWVSRTSAADNTWNSVTYGNGLFVAVANSGIGNRVMTSPDGINWTIRTSAADNAWWSVTYGHGLFVAVADTGTGNRVMTSPDGINWTIRTSAADNTWKSVTYGNGLFVAVAISGIGNRVMTSPDGINWTIRTSAADNAWWSVTYGHGLFVAVASSGTDNRVMTSPDGINWTIRTSAANNAWRSVTYGNGLFVAVAISGIGNRVMTSPDGINWTIRTSAANNQWNSVTYGNGLFVAVAIVTGTGNRVMTSPDGINWTIRTSAADNDWTSVTYGNGLFVAVAWSGTGNRVMTSGKQDYISFAHNNIYQGGLSVMGGNAGIGTTAPATRLHVAGTTRGVGGMQLLSLDTPGAPTVTPQGTTGTTTWSYAITARSSVGETLAGTAGTTTAGNATLDATNFNRLTWTAVPGAVDYRVYRTTAGGTPATTGLIGTVTAATLDDTGLAASGAVPTIDSSGNVGIGTTGPDRKLDVLDATNPQLRLTQADGTVYTDFRVDASGDLTITPSGGDVFFSDGTNTLAAIKDQGDYVFWNLKGKTDTADNPAICTDGDIYYNAFNDTIWVCHSGNTWEQLDGAGGASTLQAAYEGGNTISATSAEGNLAFTLTSADFTITTPTGGTNFTSFLRADGAGAADPAQLVLLDNLDIDRAQPIGLKVQSAAGGMTTAIDVSDVEIGTALLAGANDLSGTNWSITGATGRLQAGGAAASVAYSRFGTTAATIGAITTASDVLISGGLEMVGGLYLVGKNLYNPQGTNFLTICVAGGVNCATASEIEHTLTNGSWTIQNPAGGNVGKAALIVVQNVGSQDIFTASSGATPTTKFKITNDGNVTISGSGTMLTVGGGTGKIDVGTVDPVYAIAGKKFATYMAGMIGVKEETTGNITTSQYIPGIGYRTIVDFKEHPEGSDLWLFSRTTDIKNNIDKLVVLLSPSDNTRAWYEVDKANYTVSVYSARPTTISYRFTAPRFDYADWSNYNDNPEATGFAVDDSPLVGSSETQTPMALALTDFEIVREVPETAYKVYQTISEGSKIVVEEFGAFANLVAGNVKAGAIESKEIATETFTSFQGTIDNLLISGGLVSPVIQTETISPLADKSDVKVKIGNEDVDSGFGRLIVENTQGEEVAAIDTEGNATFSGTLEADEVKTNEVIAGKIYADEIVARNGYFGQTNTSGLSGITREEIEALLSSVESDQKLLAQASTWDIASATDSANLEELAVANLYVTEQAAVNSLSVTSAIALGPDLVLQPNSIDTLSAPLSIQSLALAPVEIMAGKVRVDTNGDVTISGNLFVAGQIESSGLTLKDGGFGDLLSLQDSSGDKVAAISATGSAEFNSVSTNKLVIAGAETTPQTADINQEIKTNATAGSAILLAGRTEITIRNPNISDYTLVYVTPTSSTQNNVLYIKAKGAGFFRVGFSGPLSQDVTFNWWVIDVNE